MNVLVPLIMEEIVEVVKVVLRERISERIRERGLGRPRATGC